MKGIRRMRVTGLVLLPVLLGAFAGCDKAAPPAPPKAVPEVTVQRPVRQSVTDYRQYTGRIDAVESVEVRARVRGYLQKVHKYEGTEVPAGRILYEIDPREYQADVTKADAEILRLEAQLKEATSEAKRGESLRSSRAISVEEYLQRVSARDVAEAALRSAKAALDSVKLQLSFTKITAPIAGRIGRTVVTEGNLVGYSEPTLLTNIVRMDEVYVLFQVSERDLLRERQLRDPTGEAAVEVAIETEEGFPHKGKINFRDNRVDPGTGTILIRGKLDNKDRKLAPGMFARVRVPMGLAQPSLLVPEEALGADQLGRYVFVVKGDNTVERRDVTIGPAVDTMVVIEGVAADERVIVKGVQKARHGAPVMPEEVTPPQAAAKAPSSNGPVGER